MEAEQSTDSAQPLKRKRSQEDKEQNGQPDQDALAVSLQFTNGDADPGSTQNGIKRQRLGARFSRMEKYTPVKVPKDKSELPGELWQYVFTFLAPPTLQHLLAVNRHFKGLLSMDKSKAGDAPSIGGYLNLLDPNFLWSTSRRTFFPNMPRPLASRTELEMWKLLSGRLCQFCGRKPDRNDASSATRPWIGGGPALTGVRIIWPFGVRSCADCLSSRMKKVSLAFRVENVF